MTTRKAARGAGGRAALAALLAAAALAALAGCATPGALHLYTLAHGAGEERIIDRLGTEAAEVPSFLEAGDTISGFAYDPFTDHFFLRLLPGDRIRVVDRPARRIKREFTIEGLAAGGDLAIRPRDGHVFFLEDRPARVVETTRLGKRLRSFELQGVSAPAGLACDLARDQLLVLHAGGREISVHDLQGARVGGFRLEQAVGASIGFDSERRELFAPLAAEGAGAVGVFDLDGRLRRRIEGEAARFVDVGPRSFVRVF